MSNSLTSWSYSKYSCYKLCPFQFKCKYIEKLPQGPAPALERGIAIHQEAEDFLNGELVAVPESCSKMEDEFNIIRDKGYEAEAEWAFDQDWNPVPFRSKDAFLRMKIDAHGFPDLNTLKTIDFKTGKMRNNYKEQVDLYTTAGFTIFDIEHAISELWYLDQGEITPEKVYHVDDYDKMVRRWERKIAPMFNDTTFAPNPNFLCKNYCDFASHKGGQCKHGQ